ncbi:MAG: ABC transporter substrate-binding protein [Methylobacteriaceae bacterium]|nr:ABC transporter substrate-binding protein [Methylobacteriaceae bacterium]
MNRRELMTGAVALGAAGIAPSLGHAQAKSEIATLELGFGLDPVFAPHVLAMSKGWLREAGFTQVNTKTFTSGALAGEALISGQIHLWTPGNLPPISMVANDVPVVVLGTNCIATEADNLVARKDANIRKPEDLYGVKIGLLAGSSASAMLHNIAKRYNLDEKRLQPVNLPPPEQLAGLKSGAVQAMLCWQPWGYNALAAGGELIHSGTTSHFEANKGQPAQVSATRSIFVASKDFVRANPNATRALMAALVRGQRYAADPANRAEVLALVAQETKQDRALVEAIWGQYRFDPTIGEGYVADMRSMSKFLVASGRVKTEADPMDYTYTAPVAAADASLVAIPGKAKL